MSKISNYEELIVLRKKLESDLRTQKAFINTELNSIKAKFDPILRIISFFGGVKDNPGSSLLKIGSNLGIELLVRQKLAKAGWLTKLILPLVMKFTAAKTIDKVQERVSN